MRPIRSFFWFLVVTVVARVRSQIYVNNYYPAGQLLANGPTAPSFGYQQQLQQQHPQHNQQQFHQQQHRQQQHQPNGNVWLSNAQPRPWNQPQAGSFDSVRRPQRGWNAGGVARPSFRPQAQAGFGGQPQGGFGQPQGGFSKPQSGFGQPQSGFSQPQSGFGQPQGGFGGQSQSNPAWTPNGAQTQAVGYPTSQSNGAYLNNYNTQAFQTQPVRGQSFPAQPFQPQSQSTRHQQAQSFQMRPVQAQSFQTQPFQTSNAGQFNPGGGNNQQSWAAPHPAPNHNGMTFFNKASGEQTSGSSTNQQQAAQSTAGKWGGQGKRGQRLDSRPHRPDPNRYRDFKRVFHDNDRMADTDDEDDDDEDEDDDDDFNGRSVVAPGKYPHMAALGFRTGSKRIEFKCGGSLISELFVLTAAHCCPSKDRRPHIVKIGDINLKEKEADLKTQRRRVVEIYVHPMYNDSLHYHDIALLELNKPVRFTQFARPIRLWAMDEIPYAKVFTMGYGSTSFAQAPTNILTELDLSVVPVDTCNRTMPPDEGAPEGIVDCQICAHDFVHKRDTCQGDSGGPLQLNLQRKRRRHRKRFRYYLVGITSYGTICRSSYPGIYTRVSSYIDWIASIVWPNYFDDS